MFKGNLTITKVFDDKEEIAYQFNNVVTDGISYGLTRLFAGDGSINIEDYQIRYFQLGTSSIGEDDIVLASDFYRLGNPLTTTQYGEETGIDIVGHKRVVQLNSETGTEQVFTSEDTEIDFSLSSDTFGIIPNAYSTKIDSNAVRFTIILDKNTGNGLELNEVGLFMKNPDGNIYEDQSVLAAYKKFGPISKTSAMSIKIDWVITDEDVPDLEAVESDVYYGILGSIVNERQVFDVYYKAGPKTDRTCFIWLHPGAFGSGDKSTIVSHDGGYWMELMLDSDLVVVSPNYSLCTSSGLIGDGGPCEFPIFCSGYDSNYPLIPSSINPLRLPYSKTNAFTDIARLVQYVRYKAEDYGINPNNIFIGGDAAGGDIASWLAYAPDFSALPAYAIDEVEQYSSRVKFNSVNDHISAFDRWMPALNNVSGNNYWQVNTFAAACIPKQLPMSGSIYHDNGTLQSSSTFYFSGNFISSSLSSYDIFSNVIGETLIKSTSSWSSYPALKLIYQWREVPLLAKRYWSGYNHASGVSSVVLDSTYPEIKQYSNGTLINGIVWGHTQNSAVTTDSYAPGYPISSLGFANFPKWRWYTPAGYPVSAYLMTDALFGAGFPADGYIEPGINIDLSTPGGYINSSALGNGPFYNSVIVTPDPHSPLYGVILQDLLINTTLSLSSTYTHVYPTQVLTPVNSFNYPTTNQSRNISYARTNRMLTLASYYDNYYQRFI